VPRILLICGDSDFCVRLRQLFQDQPGIKICGQRELRIAAVKTALELRPDLVILEMKLSPRSDFEVAEALKIALPNVPLFLVTSENSMLSEKTALAKGFDAVFEKRGDGTSLVKNARAIFDLK
jgi:DNA-binding NarL/FixJ family response regulator